MGKINWRRRTPTDRLLERNDFEIKNFEAQIKGKKTILVIPSSSLLLKENGENIDRNFDTVVRVGHGYETDGLEEWTGTRTDILYHGLKPHPKRLNPLLVDSYDVRQLCYICNWSIQRRGQRYESICKRKNLDINVIPRPSWGSTLHNFRELFDTTKLAKFKPLYGVATLADIIQLKPKELMLYGADFYQAGHQPNYDARDRNFNFKKMKRLAHKFHHIPKNKIYTAMLVLHNDNVFIDESTFNALIDCRLISFQSKLDLEKKVKEL